MFICRISWLPQFTELLSIVKKTPLLPYNLKYNSTWYRKSRNPEALSFLPQYMFRKEKNSSKKSYAITLFSPNFYVFEIYKNTQIYLSKQRSSKDSSLQHRGKTDWRKSHKEASDVVWVREASETGLRWHSLFLLGAEGPAIV